MAIKLQHLRSSVAGKAPQAADLDVGQIAVNFNDSDPALYIKDSAGSVVRIAGGGAFGGLWTRTGTELSPNTAGDDVFTSGDVKVGGTTAAPNISLKADGTAEYNGNIVANGTNSTGRALLARNNISNPGSGRYLVDIDNSNHTSNLIQAGAFRIKSKDGDALIVDGFGDVKIGGSPITTAPKISLNANGSAQFGDGSPTNVVSNVRIGTTSDIARLSVKCPSNQPGLRVYAGGPSPGQNVAEFYSADNTLRKIIGGDGTTLIGGTLPASPNIELKADGSIGSKFYIQSFKDANNFTTIDRGAITCKVNTAEPPIKVISGDTSKETARLNKDGLIVLGTDVSAGVTTNISLNGLDGSAKFSGNLNVLGAVSRVYADNTAAKAGGLVDGDVYRKADGTLMIVYT